MIYKIKLKANTALYKILYYEIIFVYSGLNKGKIKN